MPRRGPDGHGMSIADSSPDFPCRGSRHPWHAREPARGGSARL